MNPNRAEAYRHRGDVYTYEAKPEQAILDYSKAIEINPENAELYQARALVYFITKDYDKSWSDVRRAESLGLPARSKFLEALKEASRRDS